MFALTLRRSRSALAALAVFAASPGAARGQGLDPAALRAKEEAQQRARENEEQRADIERRDKDLRRRIAFADEKMKELERREAAVAVMEAEAERAREEGQALVAKQRARLEQIAGYSVREAKEELRREMEMDARREAAAMILRVQEEARERAAEEARWTVTQAMQR
ncbi:MAG: DUF3552 domain-containing protein, partial [Planctomycetes bacterium]|nr:DUF3552 domain-containing protein [Planctomycetota bacterium]